MKTVGKFNNKIVLVTGGARGIGKKIAKRFAGEGATVIISDIDREQGKTTIKEFKAEGLNISFSPIDLSKKNAPQKMIKKIIKDYGKLDVLVNNARSGKRVQFLEETEETWDQGMAVMLKAAFFASQEAIKNMLLKKEGNIINIGSIASLLVCPESPVYHAAKAGLMHLTRYLAVHGGTCGIRVNAILPGFIVQDEHVDRYNKSDNEEYRKISEFVHPLGSVGNSDDIANFVLYLCSPEASFLTGQCITLDAGLTIQEQSSLVFRFAKDYAKRK